MLKFLKLCLSGDKRKNEVQYDFFFQVVVFGICFVNLGLVSTMLIFFGEFSAGVFADIVGMFSERFGYFFIFIFCYLHASFVVQTAYKYPLTISQKIFVLSIFLVPLMFFLFMIHYAIPEIVRESYRIKNAVAQ